METFLVSRGKPTINGEFSIAKCVQRKRYANMTMRTKNGKNMDPIQWIKMEQKELVAPRKCERIPDTIRFQSNQPKVSEISDPPACIPKTRGCQNRFSWIVPGNNVIPGGSVVINANSVTSWIQHIHIQDSAQCLALSRAEISKYGTKHACWICFRVRQYQMKFATKGR